MNRVLIWTCCATAFAALVVPGAHAQTPAATQLPPVLPAAAVARAEAAALAQGWVLLAEGKYDEASRAARTALDRYPRNVSALALAVEADIARGGATTGLRTYESSLGSRTLEEPGVLRRIARAYLYEWSRQNREPGVRHEALRALADDGDEAAQAVLASGGSGGVGGRSESQAIDELVARMKSAAGSKVREIQMLGATGDPRAARHVAPLLKDALPENRAAAAEAIGTLENREAIPELKLLLDDARGLVRVAAAGALYRMGDASGVSVLQELAASDQASVRRTAAVLMAPQPDETWKALVRGLASEEDPAIRLEAARLLMPHDPEFARSLLERLAQDANIAVQEQATLALIELSPPRLPELRRILRSGPGLAKVRASATILKALR